MSCPKDRSAARVAGVICALAALMTLGACSLVGSKSEPYTIYAPRLAAPAAAEKSAMSAWQLVVDTPTASDALNSTRISVMPIPGEYQVYPGARWSDPAPRLLRRLMIESLRSSGRVAGVASESSGLHADYALATDLRDFQIEKTGDTTRAHVHLDAQLLDYSTNRVIAVQAFDADHTTPGLTAAEAASAINAAINEVLPQLSEWVIKQGQQHWTSAEHSSTRMPGPNSGKENPTAMTPASDQGRESGAHP